jgi:hypothetical protein
MHGDVLPVQWLVFNLPSLRAHAAWPRRSCRRSTWRIRGKVISASPKVVVLKTSRSTRRLLRAVWTIAPIEGEMHMMAYVRDLDPKQS